MKLVLENQPFQHLYLLYTHSMLCLGVNHKSLLHYEHNVLIMLVDYQPVLSLVNFTANFSKRLSTFTYSFQESCSLYPRCTSYFSVEHTVSPLSVVSTTSSGCTVEYTISNLERCRTYHSTATAVFGNQQGYTVIVGNSVMLSEWLYMHHHMEMEGLASWTVYVV